MEILTSRIMHNMHISDIVKLNCYLKQHRISSGQFAAMLGVDCSTIYRIRTGQTFPHRKTIQAIWEATNGQVGPNDLLITHQNSTSTGDSLDEE